MSSHRIDMKNLITPMQSHEQNDQATKRYLIPKTQASLVSFRQQGALKLVAEWQERGLETLSGHTFRKLRVAFAQPESVIAASAAG
jgi:hypothetical protein